MIIKQSKGFNRRRKIKLYCKTYKSNGVALRISERLLTEEEEQYRQVWMFHIVNLLMKPKKDGVEVGSKGEDGEENVITEEPV